MHVCIKIRGIIDKEKLTETYKCLYVQTWHADRERGENIQGKNAEH